VALPRWEDVVGYEEGRPEVIGRLAGGYPRFVIHPLVKTLAERLGARAPCLPFPSSRAAQMCANFIRRSSGEVVEIVAAHGLHGVRTSEVGAPFLKAFWQHTGMIVSSRQAEAVLAGRAREKDGAAVRHSLRQQLAGFYDCAPDDVFLTPSGMAAQFAALQAVRRRRPGQPTAQLGFPYVDTLKLQEKLGGGSYCTTCIASTARCGICWNASRWRPASARYPAIRCWVPPTSGRSRRSCARTACR
jgi:cystathionine gamma-synthase